jgi:hypothetical protein
MWFWNKLKAAWLLLNNCGTSVWNAIRSRRLINSVALIIVAAVAVSTFRYWDDIRDWMLRAEDGQIIVNSPTVYTRQRLVNDRLSQSMWLQKQLQAAESVPSEFNSIDQVEARVAENRARVSNSSDTAAQNSQKGAEPKFPESAVAVNPTTIALFRAKNAFRDELRSEMMQTQLDDRHDILGNTIYRVAFDASVLTGSQKNAVAGIKVKLSHNPRRAMALTNSASPVSNASRLEMTNLRYSEDYRQLYSDWLQVIQKLVTSGADAITQSIANGNPDPRVRLHFTGFMTGRICEFMLTGSLRGSDQIPLAGSLRGSDQIPALPEECNTASRLDRSKDSFRRLAAELIEEYTNEYFEKMSNLFQPRFDSDNPTLSNFFTEIREECRAGNLAYWPGAGGSAIVPPPELGDVATKGIRCPFYDTEVRRLIAAILLYEELQRLPDDFGATKPGDPRTILNELRARRKDYPDQGNATHCFAADFIRYWLNAFQRPAAKKWQRIGYFLTLDIVGREINDCQLVVGPRDSLDYDPVRELEYHLNEATEAFSYSVTPRNLSESISTSSEVRDDFEMLARFPFGSISNDSTSILEALRQRSKQIQGTFAHPIVVGFGSGRQKLELLRSGDDSTSSTLDNVEFGWLIAPQSRGNEIPEQIDGQYSLTAVISIPSWWLSVELDIETCWISREDLLALSHNQEAEIAICQEGGKYTKSNWTVVRLPGAIQEVSRKLGFEVVKEPYLSSNQVQELEIGQEGSLLLTGARLWRSTTVTLGAQSADSIIVLPNMEGIIARFDCVLPPGRIRGVRTEERPGSPQRKVKISSANARVWTSEGVTDAAPVDLVWPDDDVTFHQQVQDSPVEAKTKLSQPAKRVSDFCPDRVPGNPY